MYSLESVTFVHSGRSGRLRWTILSLRALADFDILIGASGGGGGGVGATSGGLSRCSEFCLKQWEMPRVANERSGKLEADFFEVEGNCEGGILAGCLLASKCE